MYPADRGAQYFFSRQYNFRVIPSCMVEEIQVPRMTPLAAGESPQQLISTGRVPGAMGVANKTPIGDTHIPLRYQRAVIHSKIAWCMHERPREIVRKLNGVRSKREERLSRRRPGVLRLLPPGCLVSRLTD